jgi:hypothetical protein
VSAKVFIGIDPGKSGGIAVIAYDWVDAIPMPASETMLWERIRNLARKYNVAGKCTIRCALEQVGGYVSTEAGEAKGYQPGSAMFQFGRNYGACRMAIIAADIWHRDVRPQDWQQALGITPRKKGEKKEELKRRVKAKAATIFPALKVTLKTADALCLARYSQMMEGEG